MAARSLSLQDHFLNSVRRAKLPVTIFLVKGVKLQGVITWFDAFSVLLRREGTSQLVYKHAISTIMPPRAAAGLCADRSFGRRRQGTAPGPVPWRGRREQERITLFLVNGVMLQGAVTGFDQFSLVLERGDQMQLIYKHAISTLQPAHALNLGRAGRSGRGGAVLNSFDGNGAIEVARGERAILAVPELPREGSRRSAEARVEEAVGLAEAIGIDVMAARSLRVRTIRPQPCSARARSRKSRRWRRRMARAC